MKVVAPKSTSPMMTEARPITIVPTPMPTSAKPLFCATMAPESATRPFEMTSPRTIMPSVLIPCARAIWALIPVARTAVPISVPKNQ